MSFFEHFSLLKLRLSLVQGLFSKENCVSLAAGKANPFLFSLCFIFVLFVFTRVELLGRSVAELKVNDEVTRQKLEEALLRLDSLQAAAQFAEATVHSLARHGDGEVSSCDDCPETPARHEMIPSTGRVRHMTESSDWSVCSNFGEGTTPTADPETTPMTTKVADGD